MSQTFRRRLPPLLALRAFETFGRTGTVRAAADELSVSHTVVSRHIQNLESAIGVKLVQKSGRGLSLTREGKRYAGHLSRALDLIASATGELWGGSSDALHICCMAGLASRRLLARLPEIERFLGGREIILQPISARPDFSQGEVDAEINYLEYPNFPPDLRGEIVYRPRILAVASPPFSAAHPHLRMAGDLVKLPLLHERSTRQWENWLEHAGVDNVPPLKGPKLWHGHLAVEAARLGQGVALVSDLMAGEMLASGELMEVCPADVRLGAYYFIAPARRWNDPAIAALREWLQGFVRECMVEPEVAAAH
ncbi:LysR family transcriptional regulator [Ancylobacter aquaticus]|uniref:LysR family transcriptional regulator n=1 Tax=Ancylobacter aquaticus TaxID=100 RepID=A0A4R1I671_ANCAQ|nr:LysR family transcriptional regulator [Ancylobacter aquaticus]TCK30864.1 LysR family transcriptional regulator [Ancylobacter aquaticus]